MTPDELPFDPFPEAGGPVEDEPPDVAWLIWMEQKDHEGVVYINILDVTTDPVRALEVVELHRGANVEQIDLSGG